VECDAANAELLSHYYYAIHDSLFCLCRSPRVLVLRACATVFGAYFGLSVSLVLERFKRVKRSDVQCGSLYSPIFHLVSAIDVHCTALHCVFALPVHSL
jgi:hypothetical protein